jgi:hypothetical protein
MATLNPKVVFDPPTRGVIIGNRRRLPAGAAADAQNWLLRSGQLRSRPGLQDIGVGTSIEQLPIGIMQWDRQSAAGLDRDQLIVGTTTDWWWYDSATGLWVEVTGTPDLSGTDRNQVQFRSFPDAGTTGVIGCNNKDGLRWWSGSPDDDFEVVDGPAPISLATLGGRILAAGNVSEDWDTPNPYLVYYSAYQDYSSWAQIDALGFNSTSGPLVALLEMGKFAVVYKTDAIHMISISGGLLPFWPDLRTRNVTGPISPATVCDIGNSRHAFLNSDLAVMVFDGSTAQTLGGHIQDFLKANMSSEKQHKSFIFFDKYHQELWVVYPRGEFQLTDSALIISMQPGYPCWPVKWLGTQFSTGLAGKIKDSVTFAELGATTFAEATNFADYQLSRSGWIGGRIDGAFFEGAGSEDDGLPIDLLLETPLITGPDPTQFQEIEELDHLLTTTSGAQPFTVSVGTADYDESVTFAPAGVDDEKDLADTPHVTHHHISGRSVCMRLAVQTSYPLVYSGSSAPPVGRGRR